MLVMVKEDLSSICYVMNILMMDEVSKINTNESMSQTFHVNAVLYLKCVTANKVSCLSLLIRVLASKLKTYVNEIRNNNNGSWSSICGNCLGTPKTLYKISRGNISFAFYLIGSKVTMTYFQGMDRQLCFQTTLQIYSFGFVCFLHSCVCWSVLW